MIIAFWAFQKFKTEIVLTSFFHHFIMNDFDFINDEGQLSQKDFLKWINLFPVFSQKTRNNKLWPYNSNKK